MNSAFDQFNRNISSCKELMTLHQHLVNHLRLPNDLSDLLRAQIVYSVSALDRLVHELIRIGMLQSFDQTRPATAKFLSFGITVSTHINCLPTLAPTSSPQYWLEQEIVQKHKHVSYQDPDKISDGLSLIWGETHKWQVIADAIGMDKQTLRTKLKTIISRRNQIAHESDINPLTGLQAQIEAADAEEVVNFIEKIGAQIYASVA